MLHLALVKRNRNFTVAILDGLNHCCSSLDDSLWLSLMDLAVCTTANYPSDLLFRLLRVETQTCLLFHWALDHGACMNEYFSDPIERLQDISLLSFASAVGHDRAVSLLLDRSANVHQRTLSNDFTPLHYACSGLQTRRYDEYDQEDFITSSRMLTCHALLNHGACVDARDQMGRTPLFYAKNVQIAALLLNRGANIHAQCTRDGNTVLHDTITNDLCDLFINAGFNIDRRNHLGHTPLHHAILRDTTPLFLRLLHHGANLFAVDTEGRTCWHHAVLYATPTIMNTLLRSGLDVNQGDCEGRTPLHLAAEHACLSVIKRLVALEEVDVARRDDVDRCVVYYAVRGRDLACLEFCLSLDASGAWIEEEDDEMVQSSGAVEESGMVQSGGAVEDELTSPRRSKREMCGLQYLTVEDIQECLMWVVERFEDGDLQIVLRLLDYLPVVVERAIRSGSFGFGESVLKPRYGFKRGDCGVSEQFRVGEPWRPNARHERMQRQPWMSNARYERMQRGRGCKGMY